MKLIIVKFQNCMFKKQVKIHIMGKKFKEFENKFKEDFWKRKPISFTLRFYICLVICFWKWNSLDLLHFPQPCIETRLFAVFEKRNLPVLTVTMVVASWIFLLLLCMFWHSNFSLCICKFVWLLYEGIHHADISRWYPLPWHSHTFLCLRNRHRGKILICK